MFVATTPPNAYVLEDMHGKTLKNTFNVETHEEVIHINR